MFFFSFCKFIKPGKCTRSFLNNAVYVLGGTNPIPSCLQKCQKNLEFPKVAVAVKRPFSLLLSGLQFYMLGTFGYTAAAVAGKKAKSDLAPQAMVKKWEVLTKDNAQTILRGHFKTPNCFLLLKDDKDLVEGTMTVDEWLQNRVAKNESTTDFESSDTGQKPNERSGKIKLSPAAIQCRKFAGSLVFRNPC